MSSPAHARCIDPKTLNAGAVAPNRTGTLALSTTTQSDQIVFDMNAPAARDPTTGTATSAVLRLWFTYPPGNDNNHAQGYPVPVSVDGSLSTLVYLRIIDQNLYWLTQPGLNAGPGLPTTSTLVAGGMAHTPYVSFFLSDWPLGWTTRNISYVTARSANDIPSPNILIDCCSQSATDYDNKNITAAAASYVANFSQSAISGCTPFGPGSTVLLYVVAAAAAVILFVIILRRV